MLGEIEIRIEGSVGAQKLTPALVDIDEIREILNQASGLLFPSEKRSQRPLISYEIEEGSVRHKFRTVMQSVIGFGAVLLQIGSQGQIDFLPARAERGSHRETTTFGRGKGLCGHHQREREQAENRPDDPLSAQRRTVGGCRVLPVWRVDQRRAARAARTFISIPRSLALCGSLLTRITSRPRTRTCSTRNSACA